MSQLPPFPPQPKLNLPPKKGVSRTRVILIVIGVILALGILRAIFFPQQGGTTGTSPSSSSSSSSNNGSQATTVPVSQPTSPPPSPAPTLTQKQAHATATAVGRTIIEQVIETQTLSLAQNALHIGTDLKSTYDNSSKQVTIQENINYGLDNASILESIKSDCFYIQMAIWQAKIAHVDTVEVYIISNSLTDQYGNTSTGQLAHCTLGKATASLFNWGNLDQDTAWNNGDYDDTWYLPSLNQPG